MPTPKYTKVPILVEETNEWMTECPCTIDGVKGVKIKVILDPDVTYEHSYQEEVINAETGVRELKTFTKTDWKEEQTFFIPDGEDEAIILSRAAWNHKNALDKKFAVAPPEPAEVATTALNEDKL